MVGAHLGFAPGHIEDHAAYVQSWLSVLRGDKRFILKASADAQRGLSVRGGGGGKGGAGGVTHDRVLGGLHLLGQARDPLPIIAQSGNRCPG